MTTNTSIKEKPTFVGATMETKEKEKCAYWSSKTNRVRVRECERKIQ